MAYNIIEAAFAIVSHTSSHLRGDKKKSNKVTPQGADEVEHHNDVESNGGTALVTKLRSKADSDFLKEWTLKYFDEDSKKDAIVVAQNKITDLVNFHNKELQDRLRNLEFNVKQQASLTSAPTTTEQKDTSASK